MGATTCDVAIIEKRRKIFLSFFDLIGVAFIGLIGSVSVAAISSTKITGRTESVINFLSLQDFSSQFQVAILGLMSVLYIFLYVSNDSL
jgi:hypothetical protein